MDQLSEQIKTIRKKMSWSQEDLCPRDWRQSFHGTALGEKGGKPIRLARMELEKLFQKMKTGNE